MIELNKNALGALQDMSNMYSSPKERFSYKNTQFLLEMNKLRKE